MIPQVVVFDLGKVLVDFDYSIAARRIAAKASRPIDDIQVFINQSPLLFRYETGLITTEQFFQEVCGFTGFSGSADEFGEFFADIFTPIPEVIELQAALRSKGVPTYIFSNTNPLAVRHVQRRFPFFIHFDGYVLSYEHGSMKPDSRLYEIVERESNRSGSAIAYLDDRLENVEAGAKRGWQTVHHQSPTQSLAALKQLGLLI